MRTRKKTCTQKKRHFQKEERRGGIILASVRVYPRHIRLVWVGGDGRVGWCGVGGDEGEDKTEEEREETEGELGSKIPLALLQK